MAAETDIATLVPVDIRDVWAGEATHFTPWLAQHAELLGEALGLDLEHEESEAAVGRFSADLKFRDTATGRVVVVENMFGPTDHRHLGQLITYAAGLEAGYAVLLATEFGDEHRSALSWLNRVSMEDIAFFGVVLEAWRIGDSPYAPRLHVEVKPDNWSKSMGAAHDSELTRRQQAYGAFWAQFLPMFRNAYPDWNWNSQATQWKENWIGFRSGSGRCTYQPTFDRCRLRVQIDINTSNEKANKETYDELYRHKQQIEQDLGQELEWKRLDDNKLSRVALYFPDSIRVLEEDRWPEANAWLVDTLGKMREAFGPAIRSMKGEKA